MDKFLSDVTYLSLWNYYEGQNFPHIKWDKTLVIFSKFVFHKNAQNLLIEVQKTIVYSTKKPDKWKKHSVSIFVLTTVFEKMCPHLIWDVLSYLSRKKGISETFLSLGLFISRPRPTASASKMRPRLQKTFPRFPFFYFGNFGQISNQTWTNFSSDVVSTKIETKY